MNLLLAFYRCRLLKEKDMDGMYLIRGGTHAGAEKVLSVWHTDKCRHYRLFKDEVSLSDTFSSRILVYKA